MNNATDHPVSGLCVDALHFGYQLARPVVQGFSASLHAGRLTALIGPNAAGKTTLLKLMLGQLRPVSGTCTIDGRDVFRMPASRRAGRISYVPQRSAAAFAFSVEQIVAMGRFAVGHSPAAVARARRQDGGAWSRRCSGCWSRSTASSFTRCASVSSPASFAS